MKSKILVVGNAALKLKMSLDMIPVAGHTALGKTYERLPAGSAVEAAAALTKYGNSSAALARIGNDANGARLRQFLDSAGCDTKYLVCDRLSPTGLYVQINESDRTERNIVYKCANVGLSVPDVEDAFNCFPDYVALCADAPSEAITAATVYANRHETPTFLLAVGANSGDLVPERIKPLKALVIDAENVRRYTSLVPGTVDASLKACMALASMFSAEYYILRLGDRGTFLYNGKFYNVITPVDPIIRNSNGFSASFYFAALITMYNHSLDIRHACEYASCAEGCCLSMEANAMNIPSPEDVKNYIVENGFNERMEG